MSKAFVDTTVLTDCLLNVGAVKTAAQAALSRFSTTELPVYAIKEFKAGPLSNFKWFHNKLTLLRSFSRALDALHGMSLSPKRYTTATAIQALRMAFEKSSHLTSKDLEKRYGSAATLDNILCDRFRFTLKERIYKAWRLRRTITSTIVFPLACYKEVEPKEINGVIDLDPIKCDVNPECCLASKLKQNPNKLRILKNAHADLGSKPENIRRSKVLRELIRKPKELMTDEMCRGLGDAYFAFFAPSDSRILTTNIRDHEPLAKAVGISVEKP